VTDVQIERSTATDPSPLRELWLAVHHRHVESMPQLAPYVDDDTSWAARRRLYAGLLAKPDTVLLLARSAGRLVGYGLAHVTDVADTWIEDTWVTAARVGEIESVGVLPELRNRGIGTALMDRLEAELRADGVHDLTLGVLAGNDAAIRLYERRGYRQTWLYMSRWSGRENEDHTGS
jgi:ribosomal protein S18 acetylase RimI-like enzyme